MQQLTNTLTCLLIDSQYRSRVYFFTLLFFNWHLSASYCHNNAEWKTHIKLQSRMMICVAVSCTWAWTRGNQCRLGWAGWVGWSSSAPCVSHPVPGPAGNARPGSPAGQILFKPLLLSWMLTSKLHDQANLNGPGISLLGGEGEGLNIYENNLIYYTS